MADTTRKKILKSAEVLFAEKGFASTTLRDVTEHAGVNVAAVNYHFGSKESLFREMLGNRVMPINAERFRLLDEALEQSGGEPLTLETLFRVVMYPVADTLQADNGLDGRFLGIIARSMTEPSEFFEEVHNEFFNEFKERMSMEVGRALPAGIDAETASLRMYFAISMFFGALIQHGKLKQFFPEVEYPEDMRKLIDSMVDFACAGMRHGFERTGPGPGRQAVLSKEGVDP